MAHGDAREGKWRGNWQMEWVASTLHTTSEHGVSSITTADAHKSVASNRLNWRPYRFKWTRPFRRKTKSGFCACVGTFQTQSMKNDWGWRCWGSKIAQASRKDGDRVGAVRVDTGCGWCVLERMLPDIFSKKITWPLCRPHLKSLRDRQVVSTDCRSFKLRRSSMNTLKLPGNKVMKSSDAAETALNLTPQRTRGKVYPKTDTAQINMYNWWGRGVEGCGVGSEQFVAINMGNWPKLLRLREFISVLGEIRAGLSLRNSVLNLKFPADHIKKT